MERRYLSPSMSGDLEEDAARAWTLCAGDGFVSSTSPREAERLAAGDTRSVRDDDDQCPLARFRTAL